MSPSEYRKDRFNRSFWNSIEPEPNSGCWLWTGEENGKGYGRIRRDGRYVYAHRVSWETANGLVLRSEQVVRHTCDNTYCVNPDHLLIGSQGDNVRDRQQRERQARGVTSGTAKLSELSVADIRKREMSQGAYARKYGVTPGHICRIQSGEKWGHIK